jgi:hypothetical protein
VETSSTPQNLAEDRGLIIRQSFLLYPGEASEVDYKSGVAFVSGESFSLKLTKHILGMANAGGGYLVIGYPENGSNQPEAGIVSDEILASYDMSDIASCVEKYIVGTEKIDIKVHKDKHPTSGQVYPIIEVGSFKSRPFFCKSSVGGVLEQHALYIRVASARTIKVATPDEWDQLIDLCVAKRQNETLRRFGELAREIGLAPSKSDASELSKKKLIEWKEEIRTDAKAETKKTGLKFEGLEIIHSLEIEKKWSTKELLNAMQASVLRNTGWPIGNVFHVPEYKPRPYKKGLRCVVASGGSLDYWFLSDEGCFYFFRTFQEDGNILDSINGTEDGEKEKREVWFDTTIWRISEGLEHTLALYRALGVDNSSKIAVAINFLGIDNRTLRASPGTGRHLFPTNSGLTTEYEWEKNTSLDTLSINLDQDVVEISNGLFAMFDFQELRSDVIQGVVGEYRGSSTRR